MNSNYRKVINAIINNKCSTVRHLPEHKIMIKFVMFFYLAIASVLTFLIS